MANGTNGNRLIYRIVGTLAVAIIVAGVGLAIAQGKTETRLQTVESVQGRHAKVIADIPVIVNEIGHIKKSIEDIETMQRTILTEIRALEK